MSIKKISRSSVTTRKNCEMRRFWTYEFRQTGMQPKDFQRKEGEITLSALPKIRGSISHELALAIVQGADQHEWQKVLDEQAHLLPESLRKVQTTLIRRAMIGWELLRGPWYREHFDVVSAEKEWGWKLTDEIEQQLRLDRILRRKDDGLLGVMDFKNVGSIDPNWIPRMMINDQTTLYVQALKERSGEFILGIAYEGVLVGKLKDGLQRSPFVTGWSKGRSVSPKWSYGAEPVDLTDYPDDKWLDWIHVKAKQLQECYATTGFLNPPPVVLLHVRNSTGRAEESWKARTEAVELIRQQYGEDSPEFHSTLGLIEKNPDMCYKYGFGHACPFVDQCWKGYPFDDQFEPREDHHSEQEEID
jgi:hypothetical protein